MAQRTLNRRSRERDEVEDDQYDGKTTDDDEDEPPRRRGRSRREEPEEDEEPPRRGRRSRDADDEDEPERKPRSRRSRDDDDEDEPRREAKPNSTSSGWKGFKQKREERSDYVKNYALPESQKEILKILDDEPFSVFAEHWLDERTGKKSFVCIGDDCPLCNVGDKPRVYAMFNVVDLRDPEEPKVFPWKVSQTTTDVLEGYAADSKTSPLNRDDLYFSIQKTGGGKKGRVQVNLNPVKARDLEEDWDITPLSAKELAGFDRYGEDDVIQFSSRKTLKEIANDLD